MVEIQDYIRYIGIALKPICFSSIRIESMKFTGRNSYRLCKINSTDIRYVEVLQVTIFEFSPECKSSGNMTGTDLVRNIKAKYYQSVQ